MTGRVRLGDVALISIISWSVLISWLIRTRWRWRRLRSGIVDLRIGIVVTVAVVHGGSTIEVLISVGGRDIWLVCAVRVRSSCWRGVRLSSVCRLLVLLLVLGRVVGLVGGQPGLRVLMLISTQCRMLRICPERCRGRAVGIGRLCSIHLWICSGWPSVGLISLSTPLLWLILAKQPLVISSIKTRRALQGP